MLANEPAFKNQFNNRAVTSFKIVSGGASAAANGVDIISGATVTSKAVINAVNAALDFFNKVKGVQ